REAYTYVILLSRRDEERISSFEQSLKTELADFLEKHATEEGYTIVGTPEITILTRRNLSFGEIKIESELVTPKAVADLDEQARAEQPVRGTLTVVNGAGACFEVAGGTTTIGRLETNDVVLEDPLASRVHAEIRQEKGSFAIVDLGSTNGTLVQGERVTETALADRDIVTIGETRLEFRRE
ncbi:MAG: FhaA domain-containing protein, partial [Terriglobia bacterium]